MSSSWFIFFISVCNVNMVYMYNSVCFLLYFFSIVNTFFCQRSHLGNERFDVGLQCKDYTQVEVKTTADAEILKADSHLFQF